MQPHQQEEKDDQDETNNDLDSSVKNEFETALSSEAIEDQISENDKYSNTGAIVDSSNDSRGEEISKLEESRNKDPAEHETLSSEESKNEDGPDLNDKDALSEYADGRNDAMDGKSLVADGDSPSFTDKNEEILQTANTELLPVDNRASDVEMNAENKDTSSPRVLVTPIDGTESASDDGTDKLTEDASLQDGLESHDENIKNRAKASSCDQSADHTSMKQNSSSENLEEPMNSSDTKKKAKELKKEKSTKKYKPKDLQREDSSGNRKKKTKKSTEKKRKSKKKVRSRKASDAIDRPKSNLEEKPLNRRNDGRQLESVNENIALSSPYTTPPTLSQYTQLLNSIEATHISASNGTVGSDSFVSETGWSDGSSTSCEEDKEYYDEKDASDSSGYIEQQPDTVETKDDDGELSSHSPLATKTSLVNRIFGKKYDSLEDLENPSLEDPQTDLSGKSSLKRISNLFRRKKKGIDPDRESSEQAVNKVAETSQQELPLDESNHSPRPSESEEPLENATRPDDNTNDLASSSSNGESRALEEVRKGSKENQSKKKKKRSSKVSTLADPEVHCTPGSTDSKKVERSKSETSIKLEESSTERTPPRRAKSGSTPKKHAKASKLELEGAQANTSKRRKKKKTAVGQEGETQ